VGTSTLVPCLSIILLMMSPAEALETTRTHRDAGLTGDAHRLHHHLPVLGRPHTIAEVGLISGGQLPMPGEVSMAHHGILLLDAKPACKRNILEVLRQPLEKSIIEIQPHGPSWWPARWSHPWHA
jgi:magnesium chelatase family protein